MRTDFLTHQLVRWMDVYCNWCGRQAHLVPGGSDAVNAQEQSSTIIAPPSNTFAGFLNELESKPNFAPF